MKKPQPGEAKRKAAPPAKKKAADIKKPEKQDTTAANQRAIVMDALKEGPKTTADLRERFGIFAPAPRVKELRDSGVIIVTMRVPVTTPDGILHLNVAKYVLKRDAANDADFES